MSFKILFYRRPSHTKDYEDKLFRYDKYAGITTAGVATINNKRISQIIEKIVRDTELDSSAVRRIEEKVDEFCTHITREVKEHIQTYKRIEQTNFIFTNYSPTSNTTEIYKCKVELTAEEDLQNPDHIFVIRLKPIK